MFFFVVNASAGLAWASTPGLEVESKIGVLNQPNRAKESTIDKLMDLLNVG